MSSINVISIDPAKSAKSALHPEVFERLARECRVSRDMTEFTLSAKKSINLFFGINKNIGRKASISLLATRVLLGAALVGFALLQGLSFSAFSPAWVMVALAASLIFGFLNRAVSLASAAYFGFLALSTAPEMTYILPAATALIFMVTGPGLFSIDQLLRRKSFRMAKENARRKSIKLAEKRLSYQAMRYM